MRVYIGYDSQQAEASEVCEYSIRKHSSPEIEIVHLKKNDLIAKKLYNRNDRYDPKSTEFTYTRFLVPYLEDYTGLAMFVDSDFLFTEAVDLIETCIRTNDPSLSKAVYVCQHDDYTPKNDTKFYGKRQLKFPRKNWSSLMVFNCAHEKTRVLTPATISHETPQWLHRLHWAEEYIGKVDLDWNYLVGEYTNTHILPPKGIHFTNGGPFNGVYGQEFEDLWYQYRDEMINSHA